MSRGVSPPSADGPPAHAFSITLVVGPDDIDALGHANNVVYVRWVQDVAVAHSRAVGLDWSAYQAMGSVFAVRRHEIDYLSPAFENDEIRLVTWVESARPATTVRRTLAERVRDGRTLARAATTWVLLDLKGGRPRRIADELMARFFVPPPRGG
jgi:acyl-CoA thioester hydrolase